MPETLKLTEPKKVRIRYHKSAYTRSTSIYGSMPQHIIEKYNRKDVIAIIKYFNIFLLNFILYTGMKVKLPLDLGLWYMRKRKNAPNTTHYKKNYFKTVAGSENDKTFSHVLSDKMCRLYWDKKSLWFKNFWFGRMFKWKTGKLAKAQIYKVLSKNSHLPNKYET